MDVLAEMLKVVDRALQNLRDERYPSRRWKIVQWDSATEEESVYEAKPKVKPKRKRADTLVPYDEFLSILGRRGNLSFLYEVNHEHRQRGRMVRVVAEPSVQGWRQKGAVPRDVAQYARTCLPEINAFALLPSVDWSVPLITRRMLRLRCQSADLLEVAYQMRREFGMRMTQNAIKGRLYNVLRQADAPILRGYYGLTPQDIALVHQRRGTVA